MFMTALLWTIFSVWVFVSVSCFYSCFSSSSSVFPSSGQHVFWEARLSFLVPDSRKAARRPQDSAAEKVTFRKELFKITSSQRRLVEAKPMSSSGGGGFKSYKDNWPELQKHALQNTATCLPDSVYGSGLLLRKGLQQGLCVI